MDKREFNETIYYYFSKVGKALTSPKRMELLDLLTQGPKTVEALSNETEMSIANTSQHLQVLLDVKLVKFRRRGNFMVYSLGNTKVCELVQSLQKVTEDRFDEVRQMRMDYIVRSEKIESLEIGEFLAKYDNKDIMVIDVRPETEYNASHIEGAVSIPFDSFKDHVSELPKDREIIVYCRGFYCVYATEVVQYLVSKGYQAKRLNAGIQHWKKEVELKVNS
ncbi:ArsR family transcriptional regulator [Bacillus sp. HNG]|uniref:metalloregulator ArsR/SmtB family transcription factor n=1 Tax=Bacillus sp. HNG TaxID=2293325 RepID=UPI000E2E789A|nr:metalloregulator ArsR/SmtB family transcription factor [Bacillus sp. HNG]RFB12685.1 ArsR family transcriptional regulator [Bacillus sp. HNG]